MEFNGRGISIVDWVAQIGSDEKFFGDLVFFVLFIFIKRFESLYY